MKQPRTLGLPTEKEIICGLNAWIAQYHDGKTLKKLHEDYKKKCAGISVQPMALSRMERILTERSELKYADILDFTEILDIQCSDIFLDYCVNPSMRTVHHFKETNWAEEPIDDEGAHGCRIRYVKTKMLPENRIRLDQLSIAAGGKSRWAPHNGQEFISLLSGGEVSVLISETNSISDAKPYKLLKGEGITFHSGLWHRIENHGKRAALLVIARPSRSKPVSTNGFKLPKV